MEYDLAVQKDEIVQFAAPWMDLEKVMLSGVSQRERDSQREG